MALTMGDLIAPILKPQLGATLEVGALSTVWLQSLTENPLQGHIFGLKSKAFFEWQKPVRQAH